MTDPVALTVSILALAVSATTAWLTLFRRGTIKMTRPTIVYFGPDAPRSGRRAGLPKVYLRTLLVATSKRGRVIEGMHVSLARNEMRQNFNMWVHGDDKLVRGSGLFVGENGVAGNHHYLLAEHGSQFSFVAGRYHLSVHAKLLGERAPIQLFAHEFEVSADVAERLGDGSGAGLYFDWGPASSQYIPRLERRVSRSDVDRFVEAPNQGSASGGGESVAAEKGR